MIVFRYVMFSSTKPFTRLVFKSFPQVSSALRIQDDKQAQLRIARYNRMVLYIFAVGVKSHHRCFRFNRIDGVQM